MIEEYITVSRKYLDSMYYEAFEEGRENAMREFHLKGCA